MFPIGICTDFENIPEAHEIGFDFVEISLNQLAALPQADFEAFADYVEGIGLRIPALNQILPDNLLITGPHVSAQALHGYLASAFDRARRLGAQVVVLDAPKSRAVPEGFDFPMAWRQLGNFLRLVQGHANDSGLRVAIEPIRKSECNLLNLVSEATLLAALLQLNNVGAAAHTGHMGMASEPLSALRRAAPLLWHVHLSSALHRGLPRIDDGEDYRKPLQALEDMGYTGNISVCAPSFKNFGLEAASALACIRAAMTP